MSVLVYGATGLTGTLIARALRARGVSLVLSGRDRSRLEHLARDLADALPDGPPIEVRPAPIHDRAALDRALVGVALVLGCAGPFGRVGEPLVAAAVAHRVHYLDIAGEQGFLRDIYERYESAARNADVLVAGGFGLQGALGDLAAHLVARALLARATDAGPDQDPTMDEIVVAYALSRFRPTAGSRLTASDTLSGPGWVWSGDRWDPVAPLAERRLINFGPTMGTGEGARATLSFPSAEVVTVPRHTPARRISTYISLADTGPLGGWMTRVAPVLSPALPALFRSPLAAQLRAQLAAPAAPSDTDRKFAAFALVIEATRAFERARMLITGSDPYRVTATIACHAVERVLANADAPIPTGVCVPAELLDPADALAALQQACGLGIEQTF